jgi:hypothetical protein
MANLVVCQLGRRYRPLAIITHSEYHVIPNFAAGGTNQND